MIAWQHSKNIGSFLILFLGIIVASFLPVLACALEDPKNQLGAVGVHTKLGDKLDLNLPFVTSDGQNVTLRDLVPKNRPAIIVPAYYDCPRLCGLVQNGVSELLNNISLNLGDDYTVITASFNPEDTVAKAAQRAKEYRAKLNKQGIRPENWHFLIGSQGSIDGLMQRLGFEYQKDASEYAHTAAIFMITPSGEIAQYLTGIAYEPEIARYALVEASQGAIGSTLDHVFLFCFRYDHLQGKYIWAAFGAMRLGGAITLFLLVLLIYRLWHGEHRSRAVG